MTTAARLFLVDVFTQHAFLGNPVAIVIAPVELPDARMLQIAQWTGMPETVFVLPETADVSAGEADYRVRIWSPRRELPFAGHPSIGAAHVMLANDSIRTRGGRFVQLSPAGPVEMRVVSTADAQCIFFRTPVPQIQALDAPAGRAVLAALGHAATEPEVCIVDAGARWLVAVLPTADEVDRLTPDFDALNRLSELHHVSGVTVCGATGLREIPYEVRSFAPAIGVPEDVVCGGGNACAAALIARNRHWAVGATTCVVGQGKHLRRSGRVFWEGPDAQRRIEIGGFAMTVSEGSFHI